MSFTVTIDGPAAAGKGTISKAVAVHFGFAHLDTGLLYRATGRRVMNGENAVQAAHNLQPSDIDGDGLRTAEVAAVASQIAANPNVRAALVDFQRAFAEREGGAVIDGRDIGTVICPDADVKLFVTASDDVRAERRFLELTGKGVPTTRDAVLNDLKARDTRDREREVSPMMPAADSVLLDTSLLTINQAVELAIKTIDTARKT